MGWIRGLSGSEVSGDYHPTECNQGAGIVFLKTRSPWPLTRIHFAIAWQKDGKADFPLVSSHFR